MHKLGLKGCPAASTPTLPETGWAELNLLASVGAVLIAVSVAIFVINVVRSLRKGAPAGHNPWGADTLEWATASPPDLTISSTYRSLPRASRCGGRPRCGWSPGSVPTSARY